MGDLFHDKVPDEFIVRVIDTIRADMFERGLRSDLPRTKEGTQRHFLLATKRYARAADLLARLRFEPLGAGRMYLAAEAGDFAEFSSPITPGRDRLWVGFSVCTCKDLETALPHVRVLLRMGLRVYLSAEPLLEALDLAELLPCRSPFHGRISVNSWAGFPWPTWVPAEVRHEVQEFWAEKDGRGPWAWLANTDHEYNHAPAFGETVTLPRLTEREEGVTGRYVHAWNNIGRLVLEDGSVVCVSTGGYVPKRGLAWVVAGGESGPRARPCHPEWARLLRDRCAAAAVPFWWKQWGEWLPLSEFAPQVHGDPDQVEHGWVWPGVGGDPDSLPLSCFRIGKAKAGCGLDGRVHMNAPHALRVVLANKPLRRDAGKGEA
jgi:hypothetical protein